MFSVSPRRAAVVGAVLGFALAAFPACGPTTVQCLKYNCSGCCDVNGDCQPGNTEALCGVDAVACVSCEQGVACITGFCGGTGAGGGGGGAGGGTGGGTALCANCNGCCDTMGNCRGGNTQTSCGLGGAACESCPATQACIDNKCQDYQCPGCVDSSSSACLPGTTNASCGTDGGTCTACTGTQSCFNGACVTNTTCGPANCSNGCCDGTVCVTPTTDLKCGANGANCAACPSGSVCRNNACLAGSGGGAGGGGGGTPTGGGSGGGGGSTGLCSLTCAGCCDAQDQCQPGDADNACGALGAACQSCSLACLGGLFCL